MIRQLHFSMQTLTNASTVTVNRYAIILMAVTCVRALTVII